MIKAYFKTCEMMHWCKRSCRRRSTNWLKVKWWSDEVRWWSDEVRCAGTDLNRLNTGGSFYSEREETMVSALSLGNSFQAERQSQVCVCAYMCVHVCVVSSVCVCTPIFNKGRRSVGLSIAAAETDTRKTVLWKRRCIKDKNQTADFIPQSQRVRLQPKRRCGPPAHSHSQSKWCPTPLLMLNIKMCSFVSVSDRPNNHR